MKRSADWLWRWLGAISPGKDELQTGVQALRDARFAAHAGVFEHQHAPDRFLRGDQLARFGDVRPDVLVLPEVGLAARRRLIGNQRVQHFPERRGVLLVHAPVKVWRALLVVWGTLAMEIPSGDFTGFIPHHGLAQRRAERLAFRIGKRGFARLADCFRLLARIRGRRVLDQRVGDGEEVALCRAGASRRNP